jgi:hypothetical protein
LLVLFAALRCLLGGGTSASGICLRFFLGYVTLGIGLVLLEPALLLEVLLAGHPPDHFLGLALDVFRDTFDAVLDATLVSHLATS